MNWKDSGYGRKTKQHKKHWVKKMTDRDYKLDKLEHLKLKHRILDTWVNEDSRKLVETTEMKARKVQKLRMKEEMHALAKELGVRI